MRTRQQIMNENTKEGYGKFEGTIRDGIMVELLLDIRDLLQKPAVIDAPVVLPLKRWRAEVGKQYWHVDSHGFVERESELYVSQDNYRYNTGNYFQTQSEAEAYREKLLADNRQ